MGRSFRGLVAAFALLLAAPATAAPQVAGEPSRTPAATPATLKLASPAPSARVALRAPTDGELALVRDANVRAAERFKPQAPRRFAIGLTRDAAGAERTMREAGWREVSGGRAMRIEVRSAQAEALRSALDLQGVALAVELRFTGNANPSRIEGPVRVGDIRDRTHPWWSPITEGDTQSIEVFAPEGVALPPGLAARVASVSHLLTTPSSGFTKRLQDIGLAGSCNVDVPCSTLAGDAAFRNAAESVAQMVFTDGSLTGLCTGTLLNDSDAATQVPYLYSANHCFENEAAPFKTPAQMQVVANSLATLWGFEATSCGSRTPRSDWVQVAGGAAWLYSNAQSDALFLRLNDAPPSYAFFSGWNAGELAAGAAVITLHHPEGDLKKASQGSVVGFPTLSDVGPGGGSFIEVLWSTGTTEPGSSGAGLWSQEATAAGTQFLFRGGLWGGTALCSNRGGTDNFSRFDRAYPNLSTYLGTGAIAFGPTRDYTDLWWGGVAQDGWGLNLVQHASGVVFGVWYTYGADGKRTWFVFSDGHWSATDVYQATLYTVAGPPQTGAFDPNLVRRTPVGSVTLSFTDASSATFRWTVGSDSATRAISRFAF